MDRVLINTPATLSQSWYQGETLADPGPVTVTVKSDDGTTVASGNASGTGAAARSFNINATATQNLDRLTVTWVSATLGTLISTVEVVGGFLFSIGELAAVSLGGAKTLGTSKTAAELTDMRTTVEDAIEHACGVAFVPRYTRKTVSGDGTRILRLPFPYTRRIRSASTSWYGTATTLSVSDIAGLGFNQGGFLAGYSWPAGYGNVTVGFEHGMDESPPRIRKAALLLAKVWLVSGPVDDRVTTMSSPDTGITAVLATPGRGGSIFGVPEVDAAVMEYRLPAVA